MTDGFVLNNVGFAYGSNQGVRGATIQLSPGKFYGVIGPNGCGKTTLLDLLMGLRQPDSGELLYQGRPVAAYSRRDLAREIGLVPQDFTISFSFTAYEVVLMGRHPYIPRFGTPTAADLAIVKAAMAELGISDLAGRYVNELSGGEKQRVVVARALAQQARVLMLDEATSNLDVQHSIEIFQVARRLVHDEGRTVIAVIHNLNLAAAFCDELVFMKQGGIHAAGRTETVMTPENILAVFGVESRVRYDDFSDVQQISFRYERV